TTRGTVAPWPAVIWRTEKLFCVVPGGRFTVNGGVRTCPSIAICAFRYTAGSLPKTSCSNWFAEVQLAGRAETVTESAPAPPGPTETPTLDAVAESLATAAGASTGAPPSTGPGVGATGSWFVTGAGAGGVGVAVGRAVAVATGSSPPAKTPHTINITTALSSAIVRRSTNLPTIGPPRSYSYIRSCWATTVARPTSGCAG